MTLNRTDPIQPPGASIPPPGPELAHGNGDQNRVVAAYIRLTRDESIKTGLSAPAQRRDLTDYARRAAFQDRLRFYEEAEAVGGDIPFERRKAGSQLIEDIKAGLVGHLLVRDLDRLTRDVMLWLQLQKVCEEQGVVIHTLSGVLASKSPSDRFASTVRAAAAQLEKEQVGDRVRRVKRELARRGRHVGGPPSFGYTSQSRRRAELAKAGLDEDAARVQAEKELPRARRLHVDQVEAEVVRSIFSWYVNRRWGTRRIANELNRLGLYRRSGLPWHPDKIRKVVSNPVVAGFIPHDEAFFEAGRGVRTAKPDQRLYPGEHDPIIDESTWRKAQEIRQANASRISNRKRGNPSYANRRFALSGVLRCVCGKRMRVASSQADRKTAYFVCTKRYYYGPKAVGGCSFARVQTGKLQHAFWGKLTEMIASPDLIDRVFALAHEAAAERQRVQVNNPDLERELRKVTADRALWYERHDDAQMDAERAAAGHRIVQLTERILHLEELLRRQPAQTPPTPCTITREQVARHLGDMAKSMARTQDEGKAVVQSLVEYHGMAVQMKDRQTFSIRLDLRPPGGDEECAREQVVRLRVQEEARIAPNEVTAWAEGEKGKHHCKECSKLIEIRRHHYWRGIPTHHHACWIRHLGCLRKNPSAEFYTGQQCADRLGIGRTTLGRWLRRGRVPQPVTSKGGILLFDRAAIDALAQHLGR